jgi:predicted ATP-dependent serine protease
MKAGNLDLYRPVPLGLPEIDACLGGGVHSEDLVLLAGMQNIGKTIVGLQATLPIAAVTRCRLWCVTSMGRIPYCTD